jgi:hypothetical protein
MTKSIRWGIVLILCSTLVLGDTAGPSSGTAAGTGWTTVANVGASDNAYATRSILDLDVSPALYISTLNFAIPAGSTIVGITATLERKCSSTVYCSTNAAKGGKIQLTKVAGTGQGTNKGSSTAWTTSDVTETLGGAADLWGSTYTTTEINDAGFGLVIVAYNSNTTSPRTAYIDYMALTVTYLLHPAQARIAG